MEDWLFYSLTTLFCLLCSLLLRRTRSPGKAVHAAADASVPPLPPGPASPPVVGPLRFLARRDFDLEPVLRRIAREHGPVFTFAPLGKARPTIFVAARGAAHRALVQRGAAFASRPVTGSSTSRPAVITTGSLNIGSAPYGASWRALRRNIAAGVLNRHGSRPSTQRGGGCSASSPAASVPLAPPTGSAP